jgi:hypothetical protein
LGQVCKSGPRDTKDGYISQRIFSLFASLEEFKKLGINSYKIEYSRWYWYSCTVKNTLHSLGGQACESVRVPRDPEDAYIS